MRTLLSRNFWVHDVSFLTLAIVLLASSFVTSFPAFSDVETDMLDVEKFELKLGFIKLTDCAPLVIAKELGYFEDEGLLVEIEAQANWKVLLDRVNSLGSDQTGDFLP